MLSVNTACASAVITMTDRTVIQEAVSPRIFGSCLTHGTKVIQI